MKSSAILINFARGGVVDEPALIDALRNGTIAGAGLDVYSEFPLSQSNLPRDMKNVFMTPWTGGRTDQGALNAMRVIKPNLQFFLEGRFGELINRLAQLEHGTYLEEFGCRCIHDGRAQGSAAS